MEQQIREEVMNEIVEMVRCICAENSSILSFEECYRKVYNHVLHKRAKLVYDTFQQAIKEYVATVEQIQTINNIVTYLFRVTKWERFT